MPVNSGSNLGSRRRERRSGQDKERRRSCIGSSTRSISPQSPSDSDPEMRVNSRSLSQLSLSDLDRKKSADVDSQAEAKGKRNPADGDSISDSQAEAKGKRNPADGDSDSQGGSHSSEVKRPREYVGVSGAVYHIPDSDDDGDLHDINDQGGGTGIDCEVCGSFDHWRLSCPYFKCFPPDGKLLHTGAYEIVCPCGEFDGENCVSGRCVPGRRRVRRKNITHRYFAEWVPPQNMMDLTPFTTII